MHSEYRTYKLSELKEKNHTLRAHLKFISENVEGKKENIISLTKDARKKGRTTYNWEELYNSILDNGYDPEKYHYITVNEDGNILDGFHRAAMLIFLNEGIDLDIKVSVFKQAEKLDAFSGHYRDNKFIGTILNLKLYFMMGIIFLIICLFLMIIGELIIPESLVK